MPRRLASRVVKEREAAICAERSNQTPNVQTRRRTFKPDAERSLESPESAFAESIGPPPKRRAKSSKRRLDEAIASLGEVFAGGAPGDGFDERHLVALYARLHREVYGVPPGELADGSAFLAACSAAKRLVREELAGSLREAVEFLRWTWRRERSAEAKRRGSGESGRRVGWKLQFATRALFTDYQVDRARRADRTARPKA